MKNICMTLFALCAVIICNAQVKPLTFSMAVKADGVAQKELYKRGKFWFVEKFECNNKQLTLDDANQGVIVGKGAFSYNSKVTINSAKTKGNVEYQVRLRFKDGRYEYEITNFKHTGSGISFDMITDAASTNKDIPGVSPEWKNEVWNDIKSQAESISKAIVKSIIGEISHQEISGSTR